MDIFKIPKLKRCPDCGKRTIDYIVTRIKTFIWYGRPYNQDDEGGVIENKWYAQHFCKSCAWSGPKHRIFHDAKRDASKELKSEQSLQGGE